MITMTGIMTKGWAHLIGVAHEEFKMVVRKDNTLWCTWVYKKEPFKPEEFVTLKMERHGNNVCMIFACGVKKLKVVDVMFIMKKMGFWKNRTMVFS